MRGRFSRRRRRANEGFRRRSRLQIISCGVFVGIKGKRGVEKRDGWMDGMLRAGLFLEKNSEEGKRKTECCINE